MFYSYQKTRPFKRGPAGLAFTTPFVLPAQSVYGPGRPFLIQLSPFIVPLVQQQALTSFQAWQPSGQLVLQNLVSSDGT